MSDELAPAVPETVVVPAFSFRSIGMEEFRANLDKRGETPWPVVFDNGIWRGDARLKPGQEIAVYKPEWNGGRPFVVNAALLTDGVTINMLADEDGNLLGTEEVSDEIQDGGGLRGVQETTGGDGSGVQAAEEEAAQAPGTTASQQRPTGLRDEGTGGNGDGRNNVEASGGIDDQSEEPEGQSSVGNGGESGKEDAQGKQEKRSPL